MCWYRGWVASSKTGAFLYGFSTVWGNALRASLTSSVAHALQTKNSLYSISTVAIAQMSKRAVARSEPSSAKRRKLEDVTTSQSQSPARGRSMTQQERDDLINWLDKAEQDDGTMFHLTISRPKKGAKKGSSSAMEQQLILNDRAHLKAHYSIKPLDKWLQMTKYKKFTVAERTYKIGDCVFVKSPDNPDQDWKAQVHEVRAADEHHVYLRVTWLETPTDFAKSINRESEFTYHGRHELIPSNWMDVIDAMSVNGDLNIVHWDEADDNAKMPGPEEYFWRQTYSYDTKTLSSVRKICKCKQPHNPDKLIINCSNKSCGKWLHAACLAQAALEKRQKSAKPTPSKATNGIKTPSDSDDEIDNGTVVENEKFRAEVQAPDGQAPHILITEKDSGEIEKEAVCCLICHKVVD